MRLTTTCFFIISTVFGYAQSGFTEMNNVDDFKKNLSEKTATTNTITAEFKQEKFMSILSKELISNGIILFKSPNKVKWSYEKPYLYDIILNGKEIIINDDGKVNAFSVGSSKMFSEMNQLIVNSVQGNVLDDTRFDITYFKNDLLYLCKLTPNKNNQLGTFLKEIHVYFDNQNYSVAQIKLVEPEGDYTQISFVNKQFNQAISDAVFNKE